MSSETETEFFDLGDKTALVCVDQIQYQKMVVSQLIELGYKVHLGLFEEDVLLKLATYNYDVVVVYDNFKGTSAEQNPILNELLKRPGILRRESFIIVLTHRGTTNDSMMAFTRSIDLIVNVADLSNFWPVLRRGVAQHQDLYLPFRETMRAVQLAAV
jgi:hypothetical protein